MKKILFSMMLLSLLVVSLVSAENVYREPEFSSPSNKIYLYNYPYWIGVNTSKAVHVTNPDLLTTNYAQISLDGGNASNMTYVASTNTFRSYVTSASVEDVSFSVTFYSNSSEIIGVMNDTLRFRVPFKIVFDFYKNANVSGTKVEPYDNEFQYAVMYYDPVNKGYSYTLESENTISWLNKFGRLFPYYKDVGGQKATVRVTDKIYLWGKMSGGSAEVTLYEKGTYHLHTLNTGISGGLTGFYEFGRPLNNGALEINSKLAGNIKIVDESDASYSVFISAWEVYKWNLYKNIAKVVLVLLLWGFCVLGLAFLLTAWLPIDIRLKAFTIVLTVISLATSPVVIMGIRAVW